MKSYLFCPKKKCDIIVAQCFNQYLQDNLQFIAWNL